MSQSKQRSMLEAATNMAVGIAIGATMNFFVLPLWGLFPTVADSLGMTALFAAISFVRSYITRRMFNRRD